MKLNPPETAPKDGTQILGHFYYRWFCLAVWNPFSEEWVICQLEGNYVGGLEDLSFTNEYIKHEDLVGWIPLPNLSGWIPFRKQGDK